ncbi:unnamed protein product [Auanema sp. JU1783]|nr:unnamed protein product [Auanema sp. JU1783]
MTWLLPIAWVLPMLDPCCKSQYYGGRMELVEMQKHEADVTYDSIDMIFETIFYVPVLCFMNGFSLILLYYQWLKLVRKKKAGNKSNSTGPLPNISVVSSLCVDREMSIYLPHLEGFESDERQERLIERLDLELSFCMISIIDQQIDFCAVLFYSLYWASYSGYVGVGATLFFEVYNYFFEIGTILSPYVLLAFCANLRKEFKEKIKCYP